MDDLSFDDLEAMKKEIAEFRAVLEESRLDSYNPDYHLTKAEMSKILGVNENSVADLSKKWEELGIFEKVNIRYSSGRRGVGYVLLPGWREKLEKDLSES